MKGKRRFKSDLIPAAVLVDRYFASERDAIEALEDQLTAVEEQLGLRLESAKGPVETLVIDSVQRPQQN